MRIITNPYYCSKHRFNVKFKYIPAVKRHTKHIGIIYNLDRIKYGSK